MPYTEYPRVQIEGFIRRALDAAKDPMLAELSHDEIYVDIARAVMHFAHYGQSLKSGERYDTHTRHIGDRMIDLLDKQVGYMHDVIENSNLALGDLEQIGFVQEVLEAVDALTKRPSELALDNLQRLCPNARASRVKKEDFQHNSDPNRQPESIRQGREEQRAMRLQCYAIGIPFLDYVDEHRNHPSPEIRERVRDITIGEFMCLRNFARDMNAAQIAFLEKTLRENSTDKNLLEWFNLAVWVLNTPEDTNFPRPGDEPFPFLS